MGRKRRDKFGLNKTERIIADAHREGLDPVSAYHRAHPTAKESTCRSGTSRILKRPHVNAYLQATNEVAADEAEYPVTGDPSMPAQPISPTKPDAITPNQRKILSELAALGFSDIRDFLDTKGKMLPPTQWPEYASAAVQSIKFKDEEISEIKLHPKIPALSRLVSIFGVRPPREIDKKVTSDEVAHELGRIADALMGMKEGA